MSSGPQPIPLQALALPSLDEGVTFIFVIATLVAPAVNSINKWVR